MISSIQQDLFHSFPLTPVYGMLAIKVGNSSSVLAVMFHMAMIAASMTSTMSIQVEGSVSTPSTGKCLTDDQLGRFHIETVFIIG